MTGPSATSSEKEIVGNPSCGISCEAMSAWWDFATTCRVGSIPGSMAYPADNAEPANQMMGHQAPGLILFVFVLWDTHSFGDLPLLHPTGGSGFSDALDEPLLIFEFCFWLCHEDRMS